MSIFQQLSKKRFSAVILVAVIFCVFPSILVATEESNIAVISNDKLKISFDLDSGLMQCSYSNDQMAFKNAFSAVMTDAGLLASTDSRFSRKYDIKKSKDNLGAAQQLTVKCKDSKKIADLEIQIWLYDKSDYFTVRVDILNQTNKDIGVIELQPLQAVSEQKGGIMLGGDPNNYKVSTEGYYMSDQGTLAKLVSSPAIGSWFNVTLFDEKLNKVLLGGFITCDTCESYLMLKHSSDSSVSFETHCTLLMPGSSRKWMKNIGPWSDVRQAGYPEKYPVALRKDKKITSELLLVIFGSDTFASIEKYAAVYRQYNQIKPKLPLAMGWCTWPYYYWAIDEDVILKNTDFVAKNFKDYGMEYIQIDGGWQTKAGDWQTETKLFPHGMKWLSDEIHKRGLKSGVWISPFEIDETSDVFKQHKDWLIKKRDGSLQVFAKAHSKTKGLVYKLPSGQDPNIYCLDVTHPEARKWLQNLFRRVAHEWGYDFVKIDWAYTTVCLAESYYDPTVTKAQAYRLALQAIRDGIGDKCYFLNCGPHTAVGIVDAGRIGADSAANWQNISKVNGQSRAIGRRYYENNNFWYDDPDMLMVRPPLTKEQEEQAAQIRKTLDKNFATGGFSLEQAHAVASMLAFSGGQLFNGDNLTELGPDRLDIIKKVLPVYQVAARPIDLFDELYPSVFNWHIEKDFGKWDVLGLFNWTETAQTKQIDLQKLGLDPASSYLIYDFWNNKFLGDKKGSISMQLEPTSCVVLSVHEKKDVPQVISTSRHITQGQIDLVDVKWDSAANTLRGVSKVVPDSDYEIVVYAPKGFVFKDAKSDASECKARTAEPNIIRLKMVTKSKKQVKWSLQFNK